MAPGFVSVNIYHCCVCLGEAFLTVALSPLTLIER